MRSNQIYDLSFIINKIISEKKIYVYIYCTYNGMLYIFELKSSFFCCLLIMPD